MLLMVVLVGGRRISGDVEVERLQIDIPRVLPCWKGGLTVRGESRYSRPWRGSVVLSGSMTAPMGPGGRKGGGEGVVGESRQAGRYCVSGWD